MTNRTEEVRKVVSNAAEQLRTPLLAALGAGNLAGQVVVDAVGKARDRVTETGEAARKNIEELPEDVTTIREKLDPAELRRIFDEYTESAVKLYNRLAENGEQTWDRLRTEPRVQDVLKQVEEVLHTAQDRVGEVRTEAREKVEEVLGAIAKRTRAGGERVATATEAAAERVEQAEDEVAAEEEPAAAKPAPKTTVARSTTTRRTSAAAKKPPASK